MAQRTTHRSSSGRKPRAARTTKGHHPNKGLSRGKQRTMEVCAPESVGLSPSRLERLDDNFARRIAAGELAGVATCIARKGGVAHFHLQGYAEDTIYRMYSMSKPVTAAAILTLFEEGRFQLDDPVSAFIPEFGAMKVLKAMAEDGPVVEDLERPVSFRHLFTHTSGICYPDEKGSPAAQLMAKAYNVVPPERDTRSLAELTLLGTTVPLAHQPGSGYTYGFSIDVLGRLIEVISGDPFDVFLRKRLLDPLGMVDTDFYVPEAKHGRLPPVYGKNEQGVLSRVDWSSDGFWKKPAFLSGGGGLVATARDFMRFALMLLNGGELDGVRILGRRTVALMTSNHIPHLMDLPRIREGKAFGLGCGYGLGGRVVMEEYAGLYGSVGTYGWDGMAGTSFFVDPKEEMAALFLTQIMPWPPAMVDQFKTLAYQALV